MNIRILPILLGMCFFVACGSNADEPTPAPEEVKPQSWIDAGFAGVLQAKGYIENAATVTPEDVAAIIDLDVGNSYLTSLKGIEYFTSLEILACHWNELTRLDVSHNTRLKKLYCFRNDLTSLDVSHNKELTWLMCTDNDIKKLDLSANAELGTLWCSGNKLTHLDLSHNLKLTTISCSLNQLSRLTLSPAAESVECFGNQLTGLDISDCTSLAGLACYNNPGKDGRFRVKAWFDDSSVPASITEADYYQASWSYNGNTVTIEYYNN